MEAVNNIYRLAPEGAKDLFNINDLNKSAEGANNTSGAIRLPEGVTIERSTNFINKILTWIKNNWQLTILAAFAIVLLWKRL